MLLTDSSMANLRRWEGRAYSEKAFFLRFFEPPPFFFSAPARFIAAARVGAPPTRRFCFLILDFFFRVFAADFLRERSLVTKRPDVDGLTFLLRTFEISEMTESCSNSSSSAAML